MLQLNQSNEMLRLVMRGFDAALDGPIANAVRDEAGTISALLGFSA